MSEATDALEREIADRRAQVEVLREEVRALEVSLKILSAGPRVVPLVVSTEPDGTWRGLALRIMSDRREHEYSELAKQVTAEFPDLNPKNVHLWLSYQLKKGKIEKVSRGRYRMR